MEFHQAHTVMRSSSRSISTTIQNLARCPGCGSPVVARRTLATTPNRGTRLRREMFQWINGPGSVFREPKQGSTNYLGAYDRFGNPVNPLRQQAGDEKAADGEEAEENDEGKGSKTAVKTIRKELMPFPLNPQFSSQSIMSENLKEELYKRVVLKNQPIREVSISLGVDMQRVAACVRMKTIEYRWKQDGRKLAMAYANAIEDMLPSTPFKPGEKPSESTEVDYHDDINELPVHPYTSNQIFHPTSESRHFTRDDAAKVFNKNFLPPEKRLQHPHLVEDAALRLKGTPPGARKRILKETIAAEVEQQKARSEKRKALETRLTNVVKGRPGGAFFRFKEVSAEDVGKNPHATKPVGWRYGNPHNDRKKGVVKIPTSVE